MVAVTCVGRCYAATSEWGQLGDPMKIDRALIDEAAEQHGVDPELLISLLELSSEFPDMAAWGAKTRLFGRISDVIEAAIEVRDQ